MSPGYQATALSAGRTSKIELVLTLDIDKYTVSTLESCEWTIDIKDSKNTTRIELGQNVEFILDEKYQNIKAYLGIEAAGFMPIINEKYTITIYGMGEADCKYCGTTEIKAKLGNEPIDVEYGIPTIEWSYLNDIPYYTCPDAPHEGRVALVLIIHADGELIKVDDIKELFSAEIILSYFDIYMYVDNTKYTITELSTWEESEASVGIRFGVEAAGFKPESAGQENTFRIDICEKGSNRVLFESEEIKVISNYPPETN